MHARPPPSADDDYATLVDKAAAQLAATQAIQDPDSGTGILSFVGAAQAAAKRSQARQGEARTAAEAREAAARTPVAISTVDLSRAAPKLDMRAIESGERRLFKRKEKRRAAEKAALESGVPLVQTRIASLVDQLDQPREPPRDFDHEIAHMLSRVGWSSGPTSPRTVAAVPGTAPT